MEVTKWLKQPNASERRAIFEKDNAQVDRQPYRGRLIRLDEMSKAIRSDAAPGQCGGMYTRKAHETRETPRLWSAMTNRKPVGTGWAPWGGGEVRSTAEAVFPWRKGPQFKTGAIRREDWRLGNHQLR